MENKKIMKFGYEDTDRSIEIDLYGLIFEIRNLESVEELENLDKNNVNVVEAQIENILGKGAIDKINEKRKNDGYKKLDLNIELNILGCIFETYAKSMTDSVLNKVTNTANDITEKVDGINNKFVNRDQRRNYNRNNNYYRGNRRNYRRY
jgi:hypothetical protein